MRHRSAVLALVTAGVLVAQGTAGAALQDGGARPGAPGAGDPYFPLDGNGGYDVAHYDLDLWYKPRTDVLHGEATITARATHALSRFNLDLDGLTVHEVHVAGQAASWSREGGELVVRPYRALANRENFTVRVVYSGVPRTIEDPLLGPSGFIHTDDGAIVAGQPHAAATWFPANDHPRDAASVSVDITVPEHLTAVSNGVLTGTRTPQPRWTTWSWHAAEPMASYLTVLAVGEFEVDRYRADGIAFFDALDPDLFRMRPGPGAPTYGQVARASLDRQPEIIRWLEGRAGDYPFAAGGGIVDDYPELFFALETQTRPIYSMLFFSDALGGDLVVVHELAHQWFGDDLRVDAWRHIWLNEGFATYMEFLWLEREGFVTAQQIYEDLTNIPGRDPFWDVATGSPGPRDMFDYEAIYLRGALALHALRLEIGDRAFSRLVRTWVAEQSGGTVTTGEFIALAERISARQLDRFFQEWLFTAARPASLPPARPQGAAAAADAAAVDAVDRALAALEAGHRR